MRVPLPPALLLLVATWAGAPAQAQELQLDQPTWAVGAMLTTGMVPAYTLEPALEEQFQRETGPTYRVECGRMMHPRWFVLGALEHGVQRHGGAYDLVPIPNTGGFNNLFAAPQYTGDLLAVQHTTTALQLTGGYLFPPPSDHWERGAVAVYMRAGLSVLYAQVAYRAAGGQVVTEPGSTLVSLGGDEEEQGLGTAALDSWDKLAPVARRQAIGLAAVWAMRFEKRLIGPVAVGVDLGFQVGVANARFTSVYHPDTDEVFPTHRLNPGAVWFGAGLLYRFDRWPWQLP